MTAAFGVTRLGHAPGRKGGHAEDEQGGLHADLESLYRFSTRLSIPRNATIFNEGDAATQSYCVISGIVRLCKFMPDGRRNITGFLFPGDLFAFVSGPEYGLAAEAATEVVVRAYPREHIARLAADRAVQNRILGLITERLMITQRHALMLGCQNAKERLASFLLREAQRADLEPGEPLNLPISRQDIADHLGLTIETVCRALSELRREGAIATPNMHQFILRADALRAVAYGEAFAEAGA